MNAATSRLRAASVDEIKRFKSAIDAKAVELAEREKQIGPREELVRNSLAVIQAASDKASVKQAEIEDRLKARQADIASREKALVERYDLLGQKEQHQQHFNLSLNNRHAELTKKESKAADLLQKHGDMVKDYEDKLDKLRQIVNG